MAKKGYDTLAYISNIQIHPASALAGKDFVANLLAFPLYGVAFNKIMMDLRTTKFNCTQLQFAHTLRIGLKQHQTLVARSALCKTLVQRLMCVQGTRNGKRTSNHASCIIFRLGFLMSDLNAEDLFQMGHHFKDNQLYSDAAKSWAQATLLGHGASHAFLSTMLFEGRHYVSKDTKLAYELASIGTGLGCAHSKGVLGRCLGSDGWLFVRDYKKGFDLGMESMMAGSLFGYHVVGMYYNFSTSANNANAMKFYRIAADQGHADAQYRLAIIIRFGHADDQGINETMRLYHLAAKQGHMLAQYNLANLFHVGNGDAHDIKNITKAVLFYILAAEQGHMDARYQLGNIFATGEGVAQDDAEAARFYSLAAAQGHAISQLNLGNMFATGRGVPRDYVAAGQLYRLASAHELQTAQFNLAIMLANRKGVPKDDDEAMKLYISVMNHTYKRKRDNPQVMQLYDCPTSTDHTRVHNDADVVQLYRLASSHGFAVPRYYLAVMLANGRGVAQDDGEAMRFYNLATEQGYKSNEFFEEDAKLLQIAAAQDHTYAQYCLGNFYRLGCHIDCHNVESVKFYRLAAKKGCVDAQYWLGWMYHNTKCGIVCRKEAIKKAIKWYKLALAQGSKQAFCALKQLSRCKKVDN